MYLIDTSVWIDSLRQIDNAPARFFRKLLADRVPYGITGAIFQEVLQGARTDQDFTRLRTYLGSLTVYPPLDPVESYAEAATLYRQCRTRGITVRSTLDCLIARIALEHDVVLLHNDRDFTHIASVVPALRTAPPGPPH